MSARISTTEDIPRIIPTPEHRRAIVGVWELNGERILMRAEQDTGALVARNSRGQRVNPLQLITRGRKCDEQSEARSRVAS